MKTIRVRRADKTGDTTTVMTLEQAETDVKFVSYDIVAVAGEIVHSYAELVTRVNEAPQDEVDIFIVPQMAGG